VTVWSKKLSATIRRLLPFLAPPVNLEALDTLDTSKFYVENVRSILGVSHREALEICETAVRQGVFQKAVEIWCPDGSVAATAADESGLPASVRCFVDNDGGFTEEVLMATSVLRKTTYYTLSDVAVEAH